MLVLNYPVAFNLQTVTTGHTVQQPLDYVKSDAQLHNRGQRLLIVPVGFASELYSTKNANISLYIDQSDQASQSLKGIVFAATNSYASHLSNSTTSINVQQQNLVTRNIRYID